jgi:glycosyltransferase involved in cell wall biosynthesis
MKVALVYDRINKWGGAERVLLALHKIFPKAPLFTSVWSQQKTEWSKVFDIRTSPLQKINYLRKHNEALALAMPISFESFNFDEFELVISVTSEAAKGIITLPNTKHICYCLTPTRYLWSGHEDYFKNPLLKFLSRPAVRYLKDWDMIASNRPDKYIAISSEVQKRIKNIYGKDSEIIYPPIMFEKNISKNKTEDFYLLVSRLSRFSYYKKVDLAIEAFNQNRQNLKIVGSGPMMDQLRQKSQKNIEFLGELTDGQLCDYYESCKALIFPGLEDFGLVMAEAQFFGKPVIAYRGGGALDIVKEGATGELFDEQTPKSINIALQKFEGKSYNDREIIKNSENFSFENFENKIRKAINN